MEEPQASPRQIPTPRAGSARFDHKVPFEENAQAIKVSLAQLSEQAQAFRRALQEEIEKLNAQPSISVVERGNIEKSLKERLKPLKAERKKVWESLDKLSANEFSFDTIGPGRLNTGSYPSVEQQEIIEKLRTILREAAAPLNMHAWNQASRYRDRLPMNVEQYTSPFAYSWYDAHRFESTMPTTASDSEQDEAGTTSPSMNPSKSSPELSSIAREVGRLFAGVFDVRRSGTTHGGIGSGDGSERSRAPSPPRRLPGTFESWFE